MDFKQAKKRAAQLTKEIRYHNELYYNQDSPEISDFEYDALTRELKAIEKEYPEQVFVMRSLSGSWCIVDPFRNRALRMGANGIEWGEENGSDELQKWTLQPDADGRFVLIPTHAPQKADKTKKYTIRESALFGSDDNSVYRIVPAYDGQMTLGNGDDGGNNVKVRAEKRDSLNRGQYWTIKTIAPGSHVIGGAFYDTNMDDGGGNPKINYLLQWPATPGNWGNALLSIINDILAGMDSKARPKVIPDRREAIAWAVKNARKDDIIVLMGKGQETYQEIGGQKLHLDEREEVAKALTQL